MSTTADKTKAMTISWFIATTTTRTTTTTESDIYLSNISHHPQRNETQLVYEYSNLSSQYFIPVAVSLTLISCIIVLINGLVVNAFFTEEKIRKRPANVLICSQSVTDVMTGILFIPVHLIETYYSTGTITSFLTCYILFLSLFNLLALSSDRYLALSRPFLHHRYIDLPRTAKLLLVIWIVPLILTLVPLCWWFSPIETNLRAQNIYLGVVWSVMFLLCILMTLLYTFVTNKAKRTIRNKRLSLTLKSQSKMVSLAKKELRVVHLFGLLLFFFVAAYLPILYMNMCDIIGAFDYIPRILEVVGLYSFILNSIVNPILCIYLKKDYFKVICKKLHFNRKLLTSRSINTEECRDSSSLNDANEMTELSNTTELKTLVKHTQETVTEGPVHINIASAINKKSIFKIQYPSRESNSSLKSLL